MLHHWAEVLLNEQLPPVLNLRYQEIGLEGAKAVAKALSQPNKCKQLHTIQLSSNSIGNEGLALLIEPLKALPRLSSLDLSFNKISDEGGRAIHNLVETVPSLTEVFLIGNDLTPSVNDAIFRSLEHNKQKLIGIGLQTLPQSASSTSPTKSLSPSNDSPILVATGYPTGSSSVTAASSGPTSAPSTNSSSTSSTKDRVHSLRKSRQGNGDVKESSSSSSKHKSRKDKSKKKSSSTTSSSSSIPLPTDGGDGRTREEVRASEESLLAQIFALKAELAEKNEKIEALTKQLQQAQTQKPTELSRVSSATTTRVREMSINLRHTSVNEKLSSGGGSNATIFSCYVDGWQCAMKELYIANMQPDEVKNFEREIQLLEAIPFNNNIVRYLFHEKDANKMRLYITKYACSLRDRILEKRRDVDNNNADGYTLREITKYCLDIAKGLTFLHQNNIIHRDLKSDNIFVKLNEQKEIAELAIGDFDTAKKVSMKTHAKTLVGTPPYMAPEVLLSNNTDPYTFKADVYSLGMVMYELLTLKLPYEDENQYNLLTLKMKGVRPRFPTELPPSHEPLFALYERCTDLSPDKRPDLFQIKEELIRLM
eukprot:TRINITY_DN1636_c0_g1_i1.p1 TRINITY_DN1636_c0_g1~~TRINITY_DN1636_c0_g1_i1.p1  ORF type:complete len:595 (-),score=151.05 TRINITY_DN1636_c0_g1_i1:45-1829(-)